MGFTDIESLNVCLELKVCLSINQKRAKNK